MDARVSSALVLIDIQNDSFAMTSRPAVVTLCGPVTGSWSRPAGPGCWWSKCVRHLGHRGRCVRPRCAGHARLGRPTAAVGRGELVARTTRAELVSLTPAGRSVLLELWQRIATLRHNSQAHGRWEFRFQEHRWEKGGARIWLDRTTPAPAEPCDAFGRPLTVVGHPNGRCSKVRLAIRAETLAFR